MGNKLSIEEKWGYKNMSKNEEIRVCNKLGRYINVSDNITKCRPVIGEYYNAFDQYDYAVRNFPAPTLWKPSYLIYNNIQMCKIFSQHHTSERFLNDFPGVKVYDICAGRFYDTDECMTIFYLLTKQDIKYIRKLVKFLTNSVFPCKIYMTKQQFNDKNYLVWLLLSLSSSKYYCNMNEFYKISTD